MKRATISVFFLLPFYLCQSPGFEQSAEVFSGHNIIQGEIQWLKPFSKKNKFLFYKRNRFTVDYDNKTTYFISAIIAYQLGNGGFDVANEMLITNDGWLPKGCSIPEDR